MIVIKAITIGLFLFTSESFANICVGRWNGDQLPNSADCGSFYVCNHGEPKLFKCLDGLLYDSVKRVCNWAYLVTCGQVGGNQEHIPVLPNPPYYPDYEHGHEEEPEGHPEVEQPHYPSTPQFETQPPYYPTAYTGHPPPLIENPNVPDYSETSEFYPGLVESIPNVFHCTHPEFYFAPHPRSCEKYFICENYRIHMHQCGEGIHWDYVFNQCDFPVKTFCFSGVSIDIDHIEHIIEPEHNEPEHHETENHEPEQSEVEPHEPEQNEPEHHEPEQSEPEHHEPEHHEPEQSEPEHHEPEHHEPEHHEENIEFSTVGVTGPIAIASIEPPTAAPESLVVECPGTQAFIADPTDCHRYYICIGGIPIVTSCPAKMAWDKDLSQCNEEAWSQCFG